MSTSFFFDLVSCFVNSALVLHGTATTACAVTVVRRGDCASLPNQQYYHEKLRAPPRAACLPPRGFRWPSNDAICFIDAFGPGEERDKTSLYNAHEASAIAECIYWLHDAGDVNSSDVVVVSFYQRQVREIRSALQQRRLRIREVTTVDGFQGSEAPVVIDSTVLCNASGHTGFAVDAR